MIAKNDGDFMGEKNNNTGSVYLYTGKGYDGDDVDNDDPDDGDDDFMEMMVVMVMVK